MGKWYFSILPMILPLVGSYLKMRDSNTTGADDTIGTICVVAGPAIEGLQAGDESKAKKGIRAIRDACDLYLQTNP